MTIDIIVNNKDMTVDDEITAAALIKELGNERAAVWINGKQLLKKEYDTCKFSAGDVVKVLRIVAGG